MPCSRPQAWLDLTLPVVGTSEPIRVPGCVNAPTIGARTRMLDGETLKLPGEESQIEWHALFQALL